MAITYEVSEDGSFVHTKVIGEYTEEDLVCHRMALVSDSRIKPGFGQLTDLTGGVASGITEESLARIAKIAEAHPDKFQGARYAIVAQKSKDFELAKLFERIYGGPANVIVFYNLDIAKTWLGCKTELEAGGPRPP
ncbi:MAG TPA: hypothetical protein VMY37_31530 [Thermoguttaceae bacterium]|nr:hypothetical protein [Thermoguttaceae bacterium]